MQDIRLMIISTLREMGITTVGFADPCAWDIDPLVSKMVPEQKRPQSIMPGSKSVIVFGIPIQKTILETAPSIYYNLLYRNVNSELDSAALRVVRELEILGFNAVYVPRDAYHGIAGLKKDPTAFFSHKHAAYLAGLGSFGVNNTILTKRYGPRIRFISVITDAEIPTDSPIKEQLCIECMRCKDECPADAIGSMIYPDSLIDKIKCVKISEVLAEKGISPCGRCITVCPVGEDSGVKPTQKSIDCIQSYTK